MSFKGELQLHVVAIEGEGSMELGVIYTTVSQKRMGEREQYVTGWALVAQESNFWSM